MFFDYAWIFHMKNTEHYADETKDNTDNSRNMVFIHCQCISTSSIMETISSNHLKTNNLSKIISNKSRNHIILWIFYNEKVKEYLQTQTHEKIHEFWIKCLQQKQKESQSYYPNLSCTPGAFNKAFQNYQNAVKCAVCCELSIKYNTSMLTIISPWTELWDCSKGC